MFREAEIVVFLFLLLQGFNFTTVSSNLEAEIHPTQIRYHQTEGDLAVGSFYNKGFLLIDLEGDQIDIIESTLVLCNLKNYVEDNYYGVGFNPNQEADFIGSCGSYYTQINLDKTLKTLTLVKYTFSDFNLSQAYKGNLDFDSSGDYFL
jgi:hypothetical protein